MARGGVSGPTQVQCVDIQKKENRDEGSFSPFLFYLRDHYNLRLELSIEI